jgi:hypothetical protein
MSKHIINALLVFTLAAGPLSAGWSITNPMDNQTFNDDDDVDANGIATHHPSFREVKFGKEDEFGQYVAENYVEANSIQVVPGMYAWMCSISPPGTGWDVSPLDGMQMPIGDHICWVWVTSTMDLDDETVGHKVVP